MTEQMIIEAVKAAGTNVTQTAQTAQVVADPNAVAKFQAAMAPQGVAGAQAVTDIPFAAQVSATWKVAQTNYQGLVHRIKALTELRQMHGPSAAELSELQYEVQNLSFQQEVVTNIAKKASDAISTLVKNG